MGTSLSIPDPNGHIIGSRDDELPIGRVSNGFYIASVTHEWVADCSTSLDVPDTDRLVKGPSDNVVPAWGIAKRPDYSSVSDPLQRRRWPLQQFPFLHLDSFSKPFAEDAR